MLLRRIRISDGRVDIDDRTTINAPAVRLPQHVGRINFDGSFSYKPVDFTLTVEHLSMLASDPDAMLRNLTGTFAIRGDDVHVDKLTVETAYSNMRVDGMVRLPGHADRQPHARLEPGDPRRVRRAGARHAWLHAAPRIRYHSEWPARQVAVGPAGSERGRSAAGSRQRQRAPGPIARSKARCRSVN